MPEPACHVRLHLDEAAAWRVAGLLQHERILFCLQEVAAARGETWRVSFSPSAPPRNTPRPNAFPDLLLEETDQPGSPDFFLSTRWFVTPEVIHRLAQLPAAPAGLPTTDEDLRRAGAVPLQDRQDVPALERWFFADSGKTQDGLVSRFLNRPVSRFVSRWLVRTPLTPNVWTLLLLPLPLAGAFFLAQGNAAGFVAGALFYHLYSILDGCDGEIARAKFLRSDFGRRLDTACDFGATLLMVLALGIGCGREAGTGWWAALYPWEGLAAALLLSLNEMLLHARPAEESGESPVSGVLYERHRNLVAGSGLLRLGDGFSWWLIQLTKRDVVLFAFVLLALAGLPEWMLHLHFGFGVVSSALAGRALRRTR